MVIRDEVKLDPRKWWVDSASSWEGVSDADLLRDYAEQYADYQLCVAFGFDEGRPVSVSGFRRFLNHYRQFVTGLAGRYTPARILEEVRVEREAVTQWVLEALLQPRLSAYALQPQVNWDWAGVLVKLALVSPTRVQVTQHLIYYGLTETSAEEVTHFYPQSACLRGVYSYLYLAGRQITDPSYRIPGAYEVVPHLSASFGEFECDLPSLGESGLDYQLVPGERESLPPPPAKSGKRVALAVVN